MKILLNIIVLFALSAANPANAQQKSSVLNCSEDDPAVAHVKDVSGGAAITVSRRSTLAEVAPPKSLCRNDVIQPSKTAATAVIDDNRQTEVLIRKRYLYYYDGNTFVAGEDDKPLKGKLGGIEAKSSVQDAQGPEMQAAIYSPQAQPNSDNTERKPIIAVYNLEDFTGSGQANSLSSMIENAIAATGKLRIVEREQIGNLIGEQALAKSGITVPQVPEKAGNFAGADFLIYGSITNISLTNRQDPGSLFLGAMLIGKDSVRPSCTNAVATVNIDLKLTDAKTGEIRFVSNVRS